MTYARRKPDRTCDDCGKPISRYTKSGVCNACGNRRRSADPAFCAKRAAGIRAKAAEPAHRAKMAEVARRNITKALANPETMARFRERGKVLARTALRTPEAIAKMEACREENGRKIHETRMAWCPKEYRAHYRYLTISRRVPAADARAQIERQIHEDAIARIAVTHASIAADYLRRLAPVYRKGDGWQLGTVTLTPAQLVDRALRRGWQPEDWSIAA